MKIFTVLIILLLGTALMTCRTLADELKFTKIHTDELFKDLNLYYDISINKNLEITAHGSMTDTAGNYFLALANTTDLGATWRAFHKVINANKYGFHPYSYFYDLKQNGHYVYIEGDHLYKIDFENDSLIPDVKLGMQDFIFQFYSDGFLYAYSQMNDSLSTRSYKRIDLSNDEITDITPQINGGISQATVKIFSPWGDLGLAFIYDLNDGGRNGKFLVSTDKGDSWDKISVSAGVYDPLLAFGYYYNAINPKSDNSGMIYFTFNGIENQGRINLVRIYNNFQTIDTLWGNDTTYYYSATTFDHSHSIKWYGTGKLGITSDMGNTYRIFDIAEKNITPLNYDAETNVVISQYITPGDSIYYSQVPLIVNDVKPETIAEKSNQIVGDFITLPPEALGGEIRIYNPLGSRVFSSSVNSSSIYLGQLPRGMYSVIILHTGKSDKLLIYKE